jgi:hypothetical protein
MKVVVIPGVGFQKGVRTYEDFAASVTKGLNCETEIYYWQPTTPIPDFKLPLEAVRKFVCDVILDFQFVTMDEQKINLPPADVYIGHSAGSVMALCKSKTPCIIMGSPALLIENLKEQSLRTKSANQQIYINLLANMKGDVNRPIVNFVNEYDVLAYPLKWLNVENVLFSGKVVNPFSYFPITAHGSYWTSKLVSKTINEKLKQWM